MVTIFKGKNGYFNFKCNLIIFILSMLPTTQQSWSNLLLAMYNVYDPTQAVSILWPFISRPWLGWQANDNKCRGPQMAEILHCPIFRAGHISAGPSTLQCKALWTSTAGHMCASCSLTYVLNAHSMRALVVRPDLICTDVCARLGHPMCTLHCAKCKCAR